MASRGQAVWLRAAGVLLLVSAAVVELGVVPAVGSDAFPGAAPARAMGAFRAGELLLIGVAALALLASRSGPGLNTWPRRLIGAAGGAALLLGLMYIDAAVAFVAHGEGMRWAVRMLWGCVALNVTAGVGMIIAAVRAGE